MLSWSIESVLMTFSASIMIQNLAVFVTFMQYQIVFSLPNIILLGSHIHSHHNNLTWHWLCYLISTTLRISLPFAPVGKKCEICIAQQAFQHTLTWLLKLNFSPWGLMAWLKISIKQHKLCTCTRVTGHREKTQHDSGNLFFLQLNMHKCAVFRSKNQTESKDLHNLSHT